jgi:dTMP kinase
MVTDDSPDFLLRSSSRARVNAKTFELVRYRSECGSGDDDRKALGDYSLLESVKKKQLRRGLLIAIEGIDGAGKTTQANLLAQELGKNGYSVLSLHEPTNGKWGQKIKDLANNGRHRTSPEDETELFYQDRWEDVKNNIKPALDEKKVIVMDRYYFSNVAYQSERGLDPQLIEKKNAAIAPVPDITIILDLEPEVSLKRIIHKRNGTPNHFEKKEKLEIIRQAFLKFRDRPNVYIIDGDDNRPIGDVSSSVWKIVEPKLKEIEQRKP